MKLSRNVLGTLLALVVISAALFAVGRRDYPNLHLILDTGMCLLSGLLALLLRDLGARAKSPFPIWVAISFGIAFLAELVHVLVTIEWSGPFALIARSQAVLRPATWPIAGFILPLGVGYSIWLLFRDRQRAPWLAPALILCTEKAHIAIDQNGLGRCVKGKLVYEPDTGQVEFPFPQQLAGGGLRALVAAPLLVESKVFGVLIAARRAPHSFSSGECEFLRQLSEHVALAANQAEIHGALQHAYDDLRLTQQAILQQERLRALGEMAGGIAHDINNALSPVALYTDALLEREPQLSAQGRGYLKVIQRAVDGVAQTVARMREFYRHREPQLALAPIQMNRLVEQVIELTRARWSDIAQHSGVVIEMARDLSPELPGFMGVESEVRDALTNLMFNAIDAMPAGGLITLRTGIASNDTGIYVELCDSGIGMDEDTRRRCLEPFFTTKGELGTGLGLAMVYGMVQRHSADIDIRSMVGLGTTVRLSFSRQSASTPLAGESAAPLASRPRLRILVVDDDPLLLKSLRDILEGDGHEVATANGGQDGIDRFEDALQRGAAFAVVISDLGMPYVDGRKVASAVKDLSPSTPVILLTGWGQRLVAEGDVPVRVDRVLGKPPKLNQLREALRVATNPTNLS